MRSVTSQINEYDDDDDDDVLATFSIIDVYELCVIFFTFLKTKGQISN